MSNFVNIPRFICDICMETIVNENPYERTLIIGHHSKCFHLCKICFTPAKNNIAEQDLNIFQKAWSKFFKT